MLDKVVLSSVLLLGFVAQSSSFLTSPLACSRHGFRTAGVGLRSACMASKDSGDFAPSAQTRRSALGAGFLALTAPLTQFAFPGSAPAEGGTVFADSERGFSLNVPAGWIEGTAEFPGASKNPARPKILSYVSPEDKDVNLAIVSYSIQPDYEKLGSLGTIEDVAGTLIGRSGNLDAEVFSQVEKKVGAFPAYVFDYRIQNRHLLTVFGIRPGEWAGNYLVTLTVQAPQGKFPSVEKQMRGIVESFKLSTVN